MLIKPTSDSLYSSLGVYEKTKGMYGATKSYGYAGAMLSLINLAYTGTITLVVIGLTYGLYCEQINYYDGGRCH